MIDILTKPWRSRLKLRWLTRYGPKASVPGGDDPGIMEKYSCCVPSRQRASRNARDDRTNDNGNEFPPFRGVASATTASPATIATKAKRTIEAAKITAGNAITELMTRARFAVVAKVASEIEEAQHKGKLCRRGAEIAEYERLSVGMIPLRCQRNRRRHRGSRKNHAG